MLHIITTFVLLLFSLSSQLCLADHIDGAEKPVPEPAEAIIQYTVLEDLPTPDYQGLNLKFESKQVTLEMTPHRERNSDDKRIFLYGYTDVEEVEGEGGEKKLPTVISSYFATGPDNMACSFETTTKTGKVIVNAELGTSIDLTAEGQPGMLKAIKCWTQ